ncbi:MarR family winged helix-turn-helix transcriptional regulator [Nocardia sp. CA-084685]|uniref:MarR family winged helix-turn-helix transcriptional regulator n=1 Tax=Nocardia sp. CA-084685 TaxID=3239970 RepID=UPI003D999C6D
MTISEAKPPVSRLPGSQTSLLYAVKRVELAVRARLDELLRPIGITTLQYTALTVLERHDGLPAAQLARDSFVTAQSVADVVRALESRGLIARERNARNRRELLIHLTEAGRRLLADVADEVDAVEHQMISGMTAEQADDFRSALVRAWHALS